MAATIPGAGITKPLTLTTADNDAQLTLTSTDADASSGPVLKLTRDSGSPADDDFLGNIQIEMDNDAGENLDAVSILAQAKDVSDASEDARLYTYVRTAGSMRDRFSIAPSETVFNEDSVDLDFRVESDQSTKAFFVNGEYGHCHITGNSSATKVSYYSSHMGALQLGVGGGIFSYDYNVIDGPYIHSNLYFPAASAKYVGSGKTGRLGFYDGEFSMYFGGSGSADASVTETRRFIIANNGDITATDTTIGAISDERLKENIQDYTYDVNKFKSFKPRTFDWKHPEAHTGEETTGFVAQEIESVDSDWVYTTEWAGNSMNKNPKEDEEKALCNNEDKKAAKFGKKDAMYISVIQQLITRIEALESA
tara:strand:+ start:39 stop:1136 length:1098 start_codon:yes stop_codon:yes gene_type:complete